MEAAAPGCPGTAAGLGPGLWGDDAAVGQAVEVDDRWRCAGSATRGRRRTDGAVLRRGEQQVVQWRGAGEHRPAAGDAHRLGRQVDTGPGAGERSGRAGAFLEAAVPVVVEELRGA